MNPVDPFAVIISGLSDEIVKASPTSLYYSTSSKTARFWACHFTPPSIITVTIGSNWLDSHDAYHWIILTLIEVHKNCFCSFIVVSESYMLLSYYLNKNCRRELSLTQSESKSVNLKRNLFIINLTSIALAAYFFVRHNDRCEGGSEY